MLNISKILINGQIDCAEGQIRSGQTCVCACLGNAVREYNLWQKWEVVRKKNKWIGFGFFYLSVHLSIRHMWFNKYLKRFGFLCVYITVTDSWSFAATIYKQLYLQLSSRNELYLLSIQKTKFLLDRKWVISFIKDVSRAGLEVHTLNLISHQVESQPSVKWDSGYGVERGECSFPLSQCLRYTDLIWKPQWFPAVKKCLAASIEREIVSISVQACVSALSYTSHTAFAL